MTPARPHALTTYSGRQLDLDACTPDEIFVEDIAAALSKICRFGAQTRTFYSVAQHAVLVRDILVEDVARPDLALYGLHHDSHEAFAGDLPSPLKAKINEEGNDVYERLCTHLDAAISEAFGFSIPSPEAGTTACSNVPTLPRCCSRPACCYMTTAMACGNS